MARVRATILGLTALAVLGLSACGTSGTAGGSEPAAGSEAQVHVLRVGIGADLTRLDPHFGSGSQTDSLVLSNVFDGLLMRDPKTMKLEPYVAESWEVSPDGLRYTFHLRHGIKFHDGDELTSDDVKWSFERTATYEGSSLASQFSGVVKSVETPDPYTVVFVLNEPNPTLLAKFETETGYLRIADKQYFDQVGEQAFMDDPSPAGSGPYVLDEWVRGQRVVLKRYPDYFLGLAAYDEVDFLPIPDEATRLSALLAGDIDVTGPISPESRATIEGSGSAHVESVETTRRIYLGINAEKAPFSDERMRKAAAYAIDVDAIIKNLLEGEATRIYGPILPFELGYSADALVRYEYDPERAKQLIAEAGYAGKPVPITITTPTGRYMKDVEATQAVAQYLNDVGFQATVQPLEFSVYLDQESKHARTELYLAGYGGGGSFDADTTMSGLFLSSNVRSYYKSPELDDMILRGRSAADDSGRVAAYAEAQRFITEHVLQIPLWDQHDIWAVSNAVDWTPLPNESLFMYFAKPH